MMQEMQATVRAVPSGDAPKVKAIPASMAGAQRVPQNGAGPTMKQNSIFGESGGLGGSQVPMAGQPQPEVSSPSLGDAGERSVVFARPSMGQAIQAPVSASAAPAAPSAAPLEPYPQVDKVIQAQSVGTSLSKIEVTAILDSLTGTLVRISAPENSGTPCVKNLGPGAVEKATTLRNKMTAYIASNPTTTFSDFTADELAGADKVLTCAGELAPPGASSTGVILAWAILGAVGVGTYFLVTRKK